MRNLEFGVITENTPNRLLSIYHVIFKSAYEAFRKNFYIWRCFHYIKVSFGNLEMKETYLKTCNFVLTLGLQVMKEH